VDTISQGTLEAVGVFGCNRKRWGLRNCSAYALLCQGTSVDIVGSKEIQTFEGDALRSQSSLFIHLTTIGGRKPLLVKILEVPSSLSNQVCGVTTSWEGWDQVTSESFLRSAHAN
jgi:hypothetical protein